MQKKISLSPLASDLITLAQEVVQHLDIIQDMRTKKYSAVKMNVEVLRYHNACTRLFRKIKATDLLIEKEVARFESLEHTVSPNQPVTNQTN